jgi:hypothetical protein
MRRLAVVLVASVLAMPGGMFAGSVSGSADDRAQMPPPSFSIARGTLRDSVKTQAVQLATGLVPASTPHRPQRQRNWAGRHPVLLGTLIGLGSGLAVGATQCGGSSDYTCAQLAGFFGGIGAGLGAGVGGVVAIASR